jgi:hypothetical protein
VSAQSGEITSLDGSTVTVKSTDGFTRDYTVDGDTRITIDGSDGALSTLKSGDDVHVMAVRQSGAWHARGVVSGDLGPRFGDRPMPRGPRGGQPAPEPPATS